jgi:hypothetical protein
MSHLNLSQRLMFLRLKPLQLLQLVARTQVPVKRLPAITLTPSLLITMLTEPITRPRRSHGTSLLQILH